MKVSVCITTLNEESSIKALLFSLINQTIKPNEIIIADGGSSDGTIEAIRGFKKNIKLIVKNKISIAEGRNIAIKNSKNDIIVMTDAGCIPDKHWIERISKPFIKGNTQVVAGFYEMTGDSSFQKSLSVFLGVIPSKFSDNFLPSTRSIAFRKSIWREVGGFSEKLKGAAEDTDFNYKLAMNQVPIVRVKNAIVEWGIPDNVWLAYKKFFFYAKGDAETGIIWNPAKGLLSHNIKVIFIILRYLFMFTLLGLSLSTPPLFFVFIFLIFAYFLWAYKKANFWGIVIQLVSDIAVMSGFISGILGL